MKRYKFLTVAAALALIMALSAMVVPPLITGVLGLLLVFFAVVGRGLVGGAVCAVWVSTVMLAVYFLSEPGLEVVELLTGVAAYFAVGMGLGRILDVLREQQRQREEANRNLLREKEFVSGLFGHQGVLVLALEREGRILRFNGGCEQVTGYSAKEAVGKNFREIFTPPGDDGPGLEEICSDIESPGDVPRRSKGSIKTKSGERRHISWSCTAVKGADGVADQFVATGVDITSFKRTQDDLKRKLGSEKMLGDVLSTLAGASFGDTEESIRYALKRMGVFFGADRCRIYVLSADGRRVSCAHEWRYGVAEAAGEEDGENLSAERLVWLRARVREDSYVYVPDTEGLPEEAGAEKAFFKRLEIRSFLGVPLNLDDTPAGLLSLESLDRVKHWPGERAALLPMVKGAFGAALIRRRAERQFMNLTYRDPRTGLYNRTFFEAELKRLDVNRQMPLSLIIISFDGRRVKEVLGCERADKMFCEAAAMLSRSCRSEDILARWNDQSFVMLLPQTGSDIVADICGRIRAVFAENLEEDVLALMSLDHITKKDVGVGGKELLERVVNNANSKV